MVLGPGHCTMVLQLYFRKLFLQLLPYFLIVLTFSFQIFHNLISACYIFCSFVCLIVFIHPSILQTAYPLQGHRRAAQHFGPDTYSHSQSHLQTGNQSRDNIIIFITLFIFSLTHPSFRFSLTDFSYPWVDQKYKKMYHVCNLHSNVPK